MTGPGPGKIRLDATVKVYYDGGSEEIEADVYLHVKGWSRALVTHIDVEAEGLEYRLVGGPGHGVYGRLYLHGRGIVFIPLHRAWRLAVINEVLGDALRRVGGRTAGYLGGKVGGVFIGARREYLRVLEEIASSRFGVKPRGRAEA